MRRVAATIAATVLLLSAAQTSAATYTVSVSTSGFDPVRRVSSPGDRIFFQWLDGPHTVTAYAGDVFDSGTRSSGAGYSYLYPGGGSVRYRCTLHSTLSAEGVCDGMCGTIDEDPVDLLPPNVVIERPTERSIVMPTLQTGPGSPLAPVLIEGAAGDNVSVLAVTLRLYDTLGRASILNTECDGCGSRVARWSYRSFLPPGSYVVEAIAADTAGNSTTSNRRSFIVV